MTTANKITIFRIVMIPVFVMMAIYYGRGLHRGDPREWQRYAALLAFVIAAASDGIDGYIARRFNQKSRLGVILDPLADKGLLLAGIFTLTFCNWRYEFPIWFPVLVIARDAVIVFGALLLHYLTGNVEIRPRWTGKVATALQMIAVTFVLLQWNPFSYPASVFGNPVRIDFLDIPVALAGIFTLASGIAYVADGIRQLQAGGHAHAG